MDFLLGLLMGAWSWYVCVCEAEDVWVCRCDRDRCGGDGCDGGGGGGDDVCFFDVSTGRRIWRSIVQALYVVGCM